MKTLADMTPQQLAECVGMWCEYGLHGEEPNLVIMVAVVNEAGRVPCINPGALKPKAWALAPWILIPRFDLPRAWTPDGQPPQGKWMYAQYIAEYNGMKDVYYFDGEPTHRQWESNWEELSEHRM